MLSSAKREEEDVEGENYHIIVPIKQKKKLLGNEIAIEMRAFSLLIVIGLAGSKLAMFIVSTQAQAIRLRRSICDFILKVSLFDLMAVWTNVVGKCI